MIFFIKNKLFYLNQIILFIIIFRFFHIYFFLIINNLNLIYNNYILNEDYLSKKLITQ